MAKSLYQSAVFCFTLAASNGVYGFVFCSSRSSKSFVRQQSQTIIQMYFDGVDSPLHMDTFKIPMQSNIFSTTSQLAFDPLFEAELLNDVSHIVLDFTTFAAPSTSWIRLFNLIGRILIIAADYVPDQYIPPDEAFFQASMMIVSTYMFLKSTYPVIKAASSDTSLSVRDRRAFKQLFSQVDLSVLQFKALLTSHTLEWVELEQSQNVSLNGDSIIYYLHSGDISSSLHEQSTSTTCFGALQLSDRLFGDVLLAKAREESMHKEKSFKKKNKYCAQGSNHSIYTNDTLIAGPKGATLLRMSTPKLLKAMEHDDRLSDSISKLILVYMQEKLSQTKWKASNAKM